MMHRIFATLISFAFWGCATSPACVGDCGPVRADGGSPETDSADGDSSSQDAGDGGWLDGHARLDLGTVTVLADGRSSWITFDLPDQASSFVVTALGPHTSLLTLARLSAPDGMIVVPEGWADGPNPPRLCVPCPNRIGTSAAEASFLVPGTPGLVVKPGPWTLKLQAYSVDPISHAAKPQPGTLQLRVDLVRRSPQLPRHGRVDLNLCLTGGHGITAEIALQHTRIQQAISEVRATYAPAGIEIGEVRAFDVEPASLTVIHDAAADGDLTALMLTGAGLPMGINVFLVDDIIVAGELGGAAAVRGLTGSIPGPPLEVGGPRAGFVVSLRLQTGEPDLLGRVMAHELGHFLGLFHTTEQSGLHDTLPDTAHGDANNLMFWAQSESGEAELTPQQADVLFANPWLQDAP